MKTIWGIKNCNSVKKALNVLDSRKIAYTFIDYKKTPPSIEKLRAWVEENGLWVVCNAKGTTYKKLGLKEKQYSLEEMITLMHQNPTLIKRPILEEKGKILFGFDEASYEKFS